MKKLVVTLVLLVQIMVLWGSPITKNTLQSVVFSFIENYFPVSKQYTIRDISPVNSGDKVTFYIVNLKPEGWILISGDDKVEPILGFNPSGYFDPDFQKVVSVNNWLHQYHENILVASANKYLVKNKLWEGFPKTEATTSTVTIEPFIDVTWDQDATFNRFCPEDASGPGGHTYVGCVAVAMAQAMSVFGYPSSGAGTKSYYADEYGTQTVRFDKEAFKWDSMANATADKYNSRLLYCTAVSVSMDFGPDGSGSYTSRVPNALKTYFKYSPAIKRVVRYSTDSAWIQLLVDELSARRPVIYSGDADDSKAGHAFDIDGVNSGKYFHLNWGWSGTYNGYFLITDLTPGIYNFTQNHEAVINVRPLVYCPTDIQLSKRTVKEGLPSGAYVGKVKIEDEATDNVYTLTLMGDSINEDTYLMPDFYLSHDSVRTLKTFSFPERPSYTVFLKVVDQYDHTLQRKFTISIQQNVTSDTENTIHADEGNAYPNPTDGLFNVGLPQSSGKYIISLMDISGHVVLQNNYEQNGENAEVSIYYDVSGIYILRIANEAGYAVYKKLVIL
jgi:hypothetical protein